MFQSARIKLAGWYLLIIMGVSIFFSVTIYSLVSTDLERRLLMAELRNREKEFGINYPRGIPRRFENLDPNDIDKIRKTFISDDLNEAKNILLIELIIINGVILVLSSSLGYFLAGRTLRPILETLKNQKQFVSDASHELRTPLTSLRTDFEVSLRNKKLNLDLSKKVLKEGLGDIVKLQLLTDRLLVLAKNGNGVLKEELHLEELIEEEIVKVQKIADRKKIKINTNLEKINIKADKMKMTELIRIFLDNGIKYTEKDGEIWVKLRKESNYIILEFKDNGIGISKENLPFIFDRFYRIDESRSGDNGFGLGLAIAKKIVKEHGGKIEVESEIGKGSVFTVKL